MLHPSLYTQTHVHTGTQRKAQLIDSGKYGWIGIIWILTGKIFRLTHTCTHIHIDML